MNAGFVAFDYYRNLLQGEDGTISGPKTVIAGFGAGITESLLAVTPFESIKTTLCVPSKCPLWFSTLMRRLAIESMIANQQNHGCVAFSTAQDHIQRKRDTRVLSRFCADNCKAGRELSHQVRKLYHDQAVCARLCSARREAGNNKHVWNRRSGWFNHSVGSLRFWGRQRLTLPRYVTQPLDTIKTRYTSPKALLDTKRAKYPKDAIN